LTSGRPSSRRAAGHKARTARTRASMAVTSRLVDHGTGDPLSPLDMKSGKVLGELVWPEEDCRSCGPPVPCTRLVASCPTTRMTPPGAKASTARPSAAALLRGKVEVHHVTASNEAGGGCHSTTSASTRSLPLLVRCQSLRLASPAREKSTPVTCQPWRRATRHCALAAGEVECPCGARAANSSTRKRFGSAFQISSSVA